MKDDKILILTSKEIIDKMVSNFRGTEYKIITDWFNVHPNMDEMATPPKWVIQKSVFIGSLVAFAFMTGLVRPVMATWYYIKYSMVWLEFEICTQVGHDFHDVPNPEPVAGGIKKACSRCGCTWDGWTY